MAQTQAQPLLMMSPIQIEMGICRHCQERITRPIGSSDRAWVHVGHCGVQGRQRCQKDRTDALAARTAEAEVERLRAVLANVEALAVEWDRLQFGSDYYAAGRERQAEVCADALRVALASVPEPNESEVTA